MNTRCVLIAEHYSHLEWNSIWISHFLDKNFMSENFASNRIDLRIRIYDNYGTPFLDYEVDISKSSKYITFRRADYLIEATLDYKEVTIYVHDELALKHALMNVYSSYIVYHNWGLLIHSSCVLENKEAHIFTGHSGAGKSTVAKLSSPRILLSDEASIIKISNEGIRVFNSPFRSEIEASGKERPSSLASIQLLHQAKHNNRKIKTKSDAYLELVDKIFYWSHSKEETKRVLNLLKFLVHQVPVYELHFQKNNTFWELIS
jgi:hypothetical protein